MTDIVNDNEVLINNLRYSLAGPIQLVSTSRGDTKPRRKVLTDTRRGIGLYKQREGIEEDDYGMIWEGLAETMIAGAITLPPLASSITGGPSSFINNPALILYDWYNSIYSVYGNQVFIVPESGSTFAASIRTLLTPPISFLQHESSGTIRGFLLCGANIDYVTNPGAGTWSRLTGTDASYGVTYNNFLWVIGEFGAFKRNATGTDAWGSWTARQSLPISAGKPLALTIYREADGSPAIYAKCERGVYIYDDTNDKWYPTELRYPQHPQPSHALAVWRGIMGTGGEDSGIYDAVGGGVYTYVTGQDGSRVGAMGPDLRDGLSSSYRGVVAALTPSHNYLLALINTSTLDSDTDTLYGYSSKSELSSSDVISVTNGTRWIAAWNGMGWHRRWASPTVPTSGSPADPSNLVVASVYNDYRAYWTDANSIYWMSLPQDILNFREISTQKFATSTGGGVIWPWQYGSQPGATDVLVRVLVRISGASANETVTLSYGLNLSSTFESGSNWLTTSDGLQELTATTLQAASVPIEFDWIRFRLQLARGATNTNRPVVEYLAYDYIPGEPPFSVYRLPIDLREMQGQRTPRGMLAELQALVSPQDMVQAVWRNQASASTDDHQVILAGIEGVTQGGLWEDGIYYIILQESVI